MIHHETGSLQRETQHTTTVPRSPHILRTRPDAATHDDFDPHTNSPHSATAAGARPNIANATPTSEESLQTLCLLMREVVAEQRHQSSLLEDLVEHTCRTRRKKEGELASWRRTHPQLATLCRRASAKLGEIQTDYLHAIVEDVMQNYEGLSESEFLLTEFVDRFGIRFTHLNNLVQMLAQLGNATESMTDKTQEQIGK